MTELQQIEQQLQENNLDEALAAADRYIAAHPDSAEAHFLRGKIYWRQGNRSAATTDYATAASLDPASPAVEALAVARSVADFFNPDIFNP